MSELLQAIKLWRSVCEYTRKEIKTEWKLSIEFKASPTFKRFVSGMLPENFRKRYKIIAIKW